MKVKRINISSKKTYEKILKAFAEEIQEKGELQRVTVTDLVKRAKITRGTFYTHFDNINDVAKVIQDETIDVLFSNMKEIHSIDDINNYFDNVITYFKEQEEIYSMILKSNDVILFMERIRSSMENKIKDYLINSNINIEPLDIIFFIDGATNLIVKYFRGQLNISLDEINSYIKNIFLKIFKTS